MVSTYIHNVKKAAAKAFKDDDPFVTLKIETQFGDATIYFETMDEVRELVTAANHLLALAEETL